ncbi:MAG: T9SS type A sorting domain-containing protein [Bacteroidota bacterium]
MKNIKYIAILVFQCALIQVTFAQSAGDNGRPVHANPGPVVKTETTATVAKDVPSTGSYHVDLDVPGAQNDAVQEKAKDVTFPLDLEIMKDEITATSMEEAQKVEELTTLVDDLIQVTEELRLENRVIRESLTNCCANSELRFSANDAYLLQNAPNPFNELAEIRYFVPEGLTNATINICDIKGSVLKSINVNQSGFGRLEVDSATFGKGTFVYTLSVGKEIIDSKVMIITK